MQESFLELNMQAQVFNKLMIFLMAALLLLVVLMFFVSRDVLSFIVQNDSAFALEVQLDEKRSLLQSKKSAYANLILDYQASIRAAEEIEGLSDLESAERLLFLKRQYEARLLKDALSEISDAESELRVLEERYCERTCSIKKALES